LTYSSASMIVLQEPDALNKVQFPDCHYQIYGIEGARSSLVGSLERIKVA